MSFAENGRDMKSENARPIYGVLTYCISLSLGLVCTGCSPKSNEQKQDEPPSQESSHQHTEVSYGEELKQLKQENDQLRKTVAKVLPFLDEVKQLNQENDDLKKAVSQIPALKREVERLKQENASLKNAIAKATKTEDRTSESYRKYKDEYQSKAAVLVAKFESANSVEAKLKFIESLSESSFKQDPSVVSVVCRALDDPNSKVARAAIELLEDYETPEILPAIAQALKMADEQIRIMALASLSGVNDPQVIELLAQALSDTSKDVRAAALEAAQEHISDPIKLSIIEKGIISQYDDVKYEVVSMLHDRSDHIAVELLIEGLKDKDPKFRAEINETLDFLIEKEFKTYEEAQAWWTQNKGKYDMDLVRIDEQ
jgi:HEAT repeat protein